MNTISMNCVKVLCFVVMMLSSADAFKFREFQMCIFIVTAGLYSKCQIQFYS